MPTQAGYTNDTGSVDVEFSDMYRDPAQWPAGWWILPMGVLGMAIEVVVIMMAWKALSAMFAAIF